jgi:hypothetical protein
MLELLLIIHYAFTLIMTGSIWLAQLSQYPLLAYVGKENFINYEKEHIRRISDIAWFIIYFELIIGALLIFISHPAIPRSISIGGFALSCLIWVNTEFVQYPIHKKLALGFNTQLHDKLVRTNWVRTAAWTARSILWTIGIYYLTLH